MKKILLFVILLAMVAAPAMAAYYETFSYADGTLIGNDGWTGTAGTPVDVNAGAAKLTYNNVYKGLTDNVTFGPINGTTIYWAASVFSGGTTYGSNAFDLRLEDAAGNPYARWYGGTYWERPRIGDLGIVLGNAVLTEGVWNNLLVVIDTVATTSTFSLNGVSLGTLNYSPGAATGGAARIRMGFQNATTAMDGAVKYYDNLFVGTELPEPGSMLALLSGLVGVVGFARRRK